LNATLPARACRKARRLFPIPLRPAWLQFGGHVEPGAARVELSFLAVSIYALLRSGKEFYKFIHHIFAQQDFAN
jgi:hypothetical protein